MLEDVAVPHVSARKSFERDDDAGEHPGVRAHCVFPSGFAWIGRDSRADEFEFVSFQIGSSIELLPVENLEANQMEVDGVRIIRRINKRPDLGRIQQGFLCNWLAPVGGVQQHDYRLVDAIYVLIEGEQARLHGLRFWNFWHGPQRIREGTCVVGLFPRYAELHDVERVALKDYLLPAMAAEIHDEVYSLGWRNQ